MRGLRSPTCQKEALPPADHLGEFASVLESEVQKKGALLP